MNQRKIIKILILILWMGIIFVFSHQPNSGETTYNIIDGVLTGVKTESLIDIINFIIRKTAHLTEYFILTLLFVFLLKEYTKNDNKIIIISIIFCLLYACTDEYHQSFIVGRTSCLRDVLIDTSGGLLCLITYIIYKLKYQKKILWEKNS